ncbi:hypothetical protein MLD38_014666 [Melastoma candidum]|uniref:Uncharacterized protein n=1 Tax=Melastoma candidum TaxID=119954 RepID=A0ACB9RCV0_9MYRT|nr:hypothetical protein MLD38_014666 [Melastoma candidum]
MMAMIRSNPTVQIPPSWDCDDPPYSPLLLDELAALQRYLPSNDVSAADSDALSDENDVPPVDAFSCDQFRMYEFKVRKCARGRSHDWTECPFAHPGEKARRRDPRRFHYSGTACPDFRKGRCEKGDSCEFAHGVFECWLHPDRYRTQPCKDGLNCRRRVCFFAHTPEQLRLVSPRGVNTCDYGFDGSPVRHAFDSYLSKASGSFVSSPTSILMSPPISPPADSPPMSPSRFGLGCPGGSVHDLIDSMRSVQIGKMKMSPRAAAAAAVGSGFGSPRGSLLRPGCYAFPSTPCTESPRYGLTAFDAWDSAASFAEEEVPMERVESGRYLRARIYGKLSKENSLERF